MNPDSVNELKQIMNNTKINTERVMHDTVRNKQYIVGSYVDGTGVSFSNTPTIQYSAMQARAECRRLAKLHPGKTFFYVRFEGAEMTVPRPNTVSI